MTLPVREPSVGWRFTRGPRQGTSGRHNANMTDALVQRLTGIDPRSGVFFFGDTMVVAGLASHAASLFSIRAAIQSLTSDSIQPTGLLRGASVSRTGLGNLPSAINS